MRDTVAYLDSVTVTGRNQLEHDVDVNAFLNAINRRKFTLNKAKLQSLTLTLIYWAMLLAICMQPLLNFSPLRNYKAFRRELDMFVYYGK